jgi:hypothetical protein
VTSNNSTIFEVYFVLFLKMDILPCRLLTLQGYKNIAHIDTVKHMRSIIQLFVAKKEQNRDAGLFRRRLNA